MVMFEREVIYFFVQHKSERLNRDIVSQRIGVTHIVDFNVKLFSRTHISKINKPLYIYIFIGIVAKLFIRYLEAIGSILNPLASKCSEDTRKKVKRDRHASCLVESIIITKCDWLTGSHMTNGSLASDG